MPREHANIRLDIWADDDWRSLSRDGQWLYMLLTSHPKTNRAGVCEWKPGRLAMMAGGTTADDVRRIAAELVGRYFVVIDEDTEEVVVRSYVKHDGVLKQPNMTTTMANDWAGLASPLIRGVVAFELQKQQSKDPEHAAWKNKRVQTILDARAIDAKAAPKPEGTASPIAEPIGHAIAEPIADGSTDAIALGSHTSTSTSTSTEASLPDDGEAKKKATRLPKNWAPTAEHFDLARERNVDVASEAEAFRLHAETHDRHAARWNAAFTSWLKKSRPRQGANGGRQGMSPDEMRRRREEAMSRG